jgi:DNA mismatch endonuclease (patch repair protein)
MPSTRVEFWRAKFDATIARDVRQQAKLQNMGWRVLVIWECELRDSEASERRIRAAVANNE